MTIKAMFNKVDNYNEVASLIGSPKAKVVFTDKKFASGVEMTDYKSFVKYIKDEYVPETAKRILNCADYEWDEEVDLTYVDDWLGNMGMPVEFTVWRE